jgi:DNA replication protein DnaC
MSQTLDHKLAELKLGRMRQVYPTWIEQAAHTEMGYGDFLEQLGSSELLARQENHLRRKMKAAGFPYAATHSAVRLHATSRTQTHGHVALL